MPQLNVIPRTLLVPNSNQPITVKRWIKDRDFPSPIQASGREPLFDVTAVQRGLIIGECKMINHQVVSDFALFRGYPTPMARMPMSIWG